MPWAGIIRRPAVTAMDELKNRGTALREAVRWLSERRCYSAQAIEAACREFDLSPRDQEFLLRHFRQLPGASQREA